LASCVHQVGAVDLIRSRAVAGAFACALSAAAAAGGCTSTTTSATAPSGDKCQVAATAEPRQFPASGGSGTVSITAARDCGWNLAAQASWVSLSGSSSGYGNAAVSYTVATNPAPATRTAEIVVEAAHLQVTQAAAACTYALNRSGDSIGAGGGTLTVQLTTLGGCGWQASTDADWLSFASARSGSSSAAIAIAVDVNSGPARSATVSVQGQTYTVSQAAAPAPVPSPGSPTPAPGPSPTPAPEPTPTPTPDPTPAPSPTPVSLDGIVSSLSGTCPTLLFSVEGQLVVTNADTDFRHGKCRDLSNGDTVSIDGMTQADGTVDASRVEITKNAK
jgi:hypothetical protein